MTITTIDGIYILSITTNADIDKALNGRMLYVKCTDGKTVQFYSLHKYSEQHHPVHICTIEVDIINAYGPLLTLISDTDKYNIYNLIDVNITLEQYQQEKQLQKIVNKNNEIM